MVTESMVTTSVGVPLVAASPREASSATSSWPSVTRPKQG